MKTLLKCSWRNIYDLYLILNLFHILVISRVSAVHLVPAVLLGKLAARVNVDPLACPDQMVMMDQL